MDAGRELDALVAEKVMGYQWEDDPVTEFRYFRHPGNFNYGMIVGKQGTDAVNYYTLPKYSADIAAAWTILETLERQNWQVRVGHYQLNPVRWNCRLVPTGATDAYVFADAPTAPHAICLAALKAVGVKVTP